MPKQARSEATRATLIDTAQRLWSQRGYAAVGTEEIVREAGVTRGALYHHFSDKRDLFRAVFESMEERLIAELAAAATGDEDPGELLVTGADAFLDHCTDPSFVRIGLLEAPTVLGWDEWREIEARYGLGLIEALIGAAIEAGVLREQPVKPLAHMLLGALTEAGMLIARADDPKAARAEVGQSVTSLLTALRA